MVDFNESEGESAFLVVRSTKGVWFDNPHVFHRSLAKVPISFCFAEGAQVQTELGPTASVKVGGYFASSADYEEWYQRRRASLTLPPSLGAEVRTFTPGSALSLWCLGVLAFLPRMGVVFAQTHSHIFSIFKYIQRYSTLFCGENGTYRARHIHIFSAFYVMR